jgi:hypothetical protein
MIFAKRVFMFGGIWGLAILGSHAFMEGRVGRDHPPAITHPEYFYGFVGVGLVWQVLFLVIARDPVRYRPLMVVAVLEKASFFIATVALFALGRLDTEMLGAGVLDMMLGVLFAIAYLRTPRHDPQAMR